MPLIARSYGAGRYGECRRVFGQTFTFKVMVAVVVAVLGLAFQRLAFSLFGAEGEVLRQAMIYGGIMFAYPGNNIAKPMVLRQIQNGDYNVVAPSAFASHKLNWPRK